MDYIAEPIQRTTIREAAGAIRRFFCVDNALYLPVIQILEQAMPLLFSKFSYDIVAKSEFPDNRHAETDVVNHIIKIREDIYDGAIKGNGRDRMTIMHEIAHYLLIVVFGVKFERNFDNRDVAAYQNPEWQAKALAGEIMCPHDMIQSFSVDEVAEKCGVSKEVAQYNLKLR